MIDTVVFDVGNVFVRWSPSEVVQRCFQIAPNTDENASRVGALFRCAIWRQLNLGDLSQSDAERAYQAQLGLTAEETRRLFFHIMDHQEPIEGTYTIARGLKHAGYRVLGLTNNVREIVTHLKARHQFWELFDGAVVSAEIGLLKPDPAIFLQLLRTFGLRPADTVFVDDDPPNIDAARSVGLQALLFTNSRRCEEDLRALGLSF